MENIFSKEPVEATVTILDEAFLELEQAISSQVTEAVAASLKQQVNIIKSRLNYAFAESRTEFMALKQADQWLHTLSEATAAKVGDEFFRTAVEAVAGMLQVQQVLIGEFSRETSDTIQTLAYWFDGAPAPQLTYPLRGTPFEEVVGKKVCVFPDQLQELFPHDQHLAQTGAQSYLGLPLFDAFGNALGLIAIMHDKPLLPLVKTAMPILKTLAFRAGAEIERKNNLLRLYQSEQQYYVLFENNPLPMWIFDGTSLAFLEVNKAAIDHYGYSREEFLSMTTVDIRPPEDRTRFNKVIHFLVDKSTTSINRLGEWRHLKKDGTIINVEINTQRLPAQEDDHVRLLAMANDITERKQAEQALAESERRYRELFENNPQMMWVVNGDTYQFIDVNESTLVHFGYSRQQFLSMTIKDLRTPEERVRLEKVLSTQAFPGGLNNMGEWQLLTSDGTIVDVEIISHTLPERNGLKSRLILATDVTHRKRAEAERQQLIDSLRESEERFRQMADSAPVMMWLEDARRHCTYLNKGWLDFTGKTLEEARGMGWLELTHPEDMARCRKVFEETFQSRKNFTIEYRLRHTSGNYRWVLDKGVARFINGNFVGYIGSCIDIDDLKQTESKLRESEANLREAQELAHLGSWEYEPATGQIKWSDETYRIYGYEPGSFTPTPQTLLLNKSAEEISFVMTKFRAALERGEPYSYDSRITLPDGSVKFIQAMGKPVLNRDGKVIKLYGTALDITERKQAEERIRQSQQLYRSITRNFPHAVIALLNRELEVVFVEGQLLEDLNMPADLFLGKKIVDILPSEKSVLHIGFYERTFKGEGTSFEYLVNDRHYITNTVPLPNSHNQIDQIMVVIQNVTMQKKAEAKLRESERNLKEAQRLAHLGNWSYDLVSGETYWSEETYRIYGYDPAQYSTPPRYELWRRIPASERKNALDLLRATLQEGIPCNYDSALLMDDGSVRHTQIIAKPVHDETGKIVRIEGTVMDITDRKNVELKLQHRLETENLIASISKLFVNVAADDLDMAIYTALSHISHSSGAEKATVFMFNESMTVMAITHEWSVKGITQLQDEFQDFPLTAFTWWKKQLQASEVIYAVRLSDLPEEAVYEKQMLAAVGIRSTIAVPIIYHHKLIGCITICSITHEKHWQEEDAFMLRMLAEMMGNALQRREAEREVIKQKEYLRQVIDTDPNLVFVKNYDSEFLLVNKAFADLLQLPMEKIIGQNCKVMNLKEDEVKYYTEADKLVLERLEPVMREENFTYTATGKVYHFLTTRKPLILPDGSVSVLGVSVDITERKKSEEALRKNEQLLQTVFNNSTDALFLVNKYTQIIEDCNEVAVEMFGFSDKQQLIGKRGDQWQKHHFSSEEAQEIVARVEQKGAFNSEVEYINAQGKTFWGSLAIKPIEADNQNIQLVRITNINERKLAELRLKASYKTLADFRAALDVSAIVAITDVNGVITYVNDNFCTVSGYRREELVGVSHKLLNSGYHPSSFFAHLWNTIRAGKVWQGEIKNKTKNGSYYWEFVSIIPFLDEQGAPTQYLEIRNDITSRKQAEEDLMIAKEKAEESNRLKSRFLANMSHEIRTPLNGIMGLAQIIGVETKSEEVGEYAKLIEDSGHRLLRTINHILDLSKIEAQKIELQLNSCNISDIADKVARSLKVLADQKNLSMVVEKRAGDVYAKADETLLGQILNNLIGNAIKFTETGGITITVDKAGNNASIRVTDTGIGIPDEYFSKLFTPFSQASTAVYGRRHQGTGLGLSISKNFAEMMGGKIQVSSREGQGSTFEILLPISHQSSVSSQQ